MSVARADRPAEGTLAEYDDLPYDCLPFPQTHPARLNTLARLFGLRAPEVETCRVLEVGCANGNNLIPMAAALPAARFVGIDLSARQVADGRALISAAGLTNIELRHGDLASIGPRDGTFDYVVAHGVYSWVPAPVRDKLLSIARSNLAPHGVAYVSYNTLPGWSTNGVLRDMMRFHTRDIEGASERMRAGRALLGVLARAVPDTPYGTLMREEIAFLERQPDEYVAHDHMAECNEPVYFHQFAAHAAKHRLQYLAEAEFSMMGLGGVPPQTIATMRKLAPDIVEFEQLTDILRHRAFRQTLLVHDDASIDRRLGAQSIEPFAIASPVTLAPRGGLHAANAPVVFVAKNGNTFSIGNALTRAALLHLIERWPESVPFRGLYEAARRALPPSLASSGGERAVGADMLAVELLQLYAAGIAELRIWDPGASATVAERPAASALARIQAMRGTELTTLLHQPLTLTPFDRSLVPLLDGNRDTSQLLEVLREAADGNAAIGERGASRADAALTLRSGLQRLAKAGVLLKAKPSRRETLASAAASAFAAFVWSLQFELV